MIMNSYEVSETKKDLLTEWLKDCPVYYEWDHSDMGVATIKFDLLVHKDEEK